MNAWPQWLIAAAFAIRFVSHVWKSATRKEDLVSRISNMTGCFIAEGISIYLLFEGGFWAIWGWKP